MPIPEMELKRAERSLSAFCERVPPEIRHQLSYHWTISRNQITLLEKRPHLFHPDEFTNMEVARFQYRVTRGTWTLKWADRNGRFHIYEGFEDRKQFRTLLQEVEKDPTGIFFG